MKFNKMTPQVMICYLKRTPQNQFQNFENNSPTKWLPNPGAGEIELFTERKQNIALLHVSYHN